LSKNNGYITVEPEQVIKVLDSMQNELKQLREIMTNGFTSKLPAIPSTLDISGIKWKIKGGADATLNDGFAFAFAKDRNGGALPELNNIIAELNRGPITQNGFKIGISKDGKFLQRNKV